MWAESVTCLLASAWWAMPVGRPPASLSWPPGWPRSGPKPTWSEPPQTPNREEVRTRADKARSASDRGREGKLAPKVSSPGEVELATQEGNDQRRRAAEGATATAIAAQSAAECPTVMANAAKGPFPSPLGCSRRNSRVSPPPPPCGTAIASGRRTGSSPMLK